MTAFGAEHIQGILPMSKTSATDGLGRRQVSNLVRSGGRGPSGTADERPCLSVALSLYGNATRHRNGLRRPVFIAAVRYAYGCTFGTSGCFHDATKHAIVSFRLVALSFVRLPSCLSVERSALEIIQFFMNLLSDPRGAIAGWIVALGPFWVYSPLFLIVFVETGLVFFPFLPGDSLLFAAGVFSADGGGLNIWATLFIFYAAAILGNTSNYWIARFFRLSASSFRQGEGVDPQAHGQARPLLRKVRRPYYCDYALYAVSFRTFAPFIAGTGHMNFAKFTLFNVIGGVSWVTSFVLVRCFGGISFVQEHFEVIVLGIVAVSVAPAIIGAIKAAMNSRKKKKEQA